MSLLFCIFFFFGLNPKNIFSFQKRFFFVFSLNIYLIEGSRADQVRGLLSEVDPTLQEVKIVVIEQASFRVSIPQNSSSQEEYVWNLPVEYEGKVRFGVYGTSVSCCKGLNLLN